MSRKTKKWFRQINQNNENITKKLSMCICSASLKKSVISQRTIIFIFPFLFPTSIYFKNINHPHVLCEVCTRVPFFHFIFMVFFSFSFKQHKINSNNNLIICDDVFHYRNMGVKDKHKKNIQFNFSHLSFSPWSVYYRSTCSHEKYIVESMRTNPTLTETCVTNKIEH